MPDVGSYFDKLTKRGRGGRRLGPDQTAGPATGTTTPPDGSLRSRVKDMLDKARGPGTTSPARPRPTPTTGSPTRSTGRRSSKAAVTIEYSPEIDGDPDPGEVVWTWVPFEEDPAQGKDRPVAIIGRRNGNLVGVPLTTKADKREAQVSVGTGAWDPERRTSYARIWRMLDVDERKMRREGAILERARFDDIIDAVDDYYEVIYPAAAPSKDDGIDYDY
ncbi:MAG TPA: type II toxin-antitoxin system PemK/MazF family toxin [Ilumatobacter sp.]|nr:type II toxin-antitoxin system PemK/MazF family toxin [Ilumatobacter sp.]